MIKICEDSTESREEGKDPFEKMLGDRLGEELRKQRMKLTYFKRKTDKQRRRHQRL